MASLSTSDLSFVRLIIGDEAETAFSDSELNTLYTQAGSDLNITMALCFEVLRNSAAKFADYKQNESEEKRNQIFANLDKLAKYYRGLATTTGNQVKVVGLKQRPPRNKTKPRGM